jgi:hypothetical protein
VDKKMKGIDCATPINRESAARLAEQGVLFVGRYLVPDYPSLSWKRLTPDEVQACTEQGIKILSVFEMSAGDMKNGNGTEHGALAYQEAQAIQQPLGTPIFFTVDFEAQERDYDTIEQYLRAAKEQIPGYKIGVYGSFFVVEEMVRRGATDYFWQTYAWSGNNLSNAAHVYQYQNDTTLAGLNVDIDDFYTDEVTWNYNTQIQTEQPEQEEQGMKEMTVDEAIQILVDNGVINSPEQWQKAVEVVKYLDQLFINMAKKLKG